MEQERLNYCLYHQQELRAEFYQGLSDAISSGDVNGSSVGRKMISPSSYIGSPRYMHQLYQDAMAIVRKFGKPDLFITFTCNPNWPEVKNSLIGTHSSADQPDLTTRVFHLKLKDPLKDIVDKQVFGKTLAYVYVVEFQKRGLPHAHFLIILDQNSKPRNPDHFDEYVSAEIPDPILLPEMHQIVTMHMIHGPCGKANPHSPCKADENAQKSFQRIILKKLYNHSMDTQCINEGQWHNSLKKWTES
ncbi:unnamed protein product [Mytilus coruscus]|uniref:Helitron helicase-like domain-containing protein n=1 Tax=Mytilus coruscus TaxID=42192 RepID=A0A6J8E1Y6_MYTCO|nr:unnamed protein product [Mytilus coruscus]